MAEAGAYTVRDAIWPADEAAIRRVRSTVFVDEQGVDPALEWDGRDAVCRHVVAVSASGAVIGTGRLLPDGHIGRMAVLAAWRKRGVGTALLQALVAQAARAGHHEVCLNAQVHAMDFYTRHGFAATGTPFMEAGIAHQSMHRTLA